MITIPAIMISIARILIALGSKPTVRPPRLKRTSLHGNEEATDEEAARGIEAQVRDPYRCIASSSASTQNSTSIVFDTRHANTRRECQSMPANQVHESLGHRQITNVGSPDLVGTVNVEPSEQIRIHLVWTCDASGPAPDGSDGPRGAVSGPAGNRRGSPDRPCVFYDRSRT